MAATLAMLGCRIQSQGAYWIEAHGDGLALRLAAHGGGVTAIGIDSLLYLYPTDWGRPWRPLGSQQAKTISASASAVYAITPNGEVSRIVNGQWTAYAGSVGWGATALAASADDALFVIVGGRVRRVDEGELRDAPCGTVVATAITAAGRDEIYVIDKEGTLYHGTAGACLLLKTPTGVKDVAAAGQRIVVVGNDGTLWRRRGEGPWEALPPIRKYRPNGWAVGKLATQVSLSAYSTWALDQDGSVFVLSDET